MTEDLDASEHTGSSWSIQASCEYISETQAEHIFKGIKNPSDQNDALKSYRTYTPQCSGECKLIPELHGLASPQALQMKHWRNEGNFQNQTRLGIIFLRQSESSLAQFTAW